MTRILNRRVLWEMELNDVIINTVGGPHHVCPLVVKTQSSGAAGKCSLGSSELRRGKDKRRPVTDILKGEDSAPCSRLVGGYCRLGGSEVIVDESRSAGLHQFHKLPL